MSYLALGRSRQTDSRRNADPEHRGPGEGRRHRDVRGAEGPRATFQAALRQRHRSHAGVEPEKEAGTEIVNRGF